MPKLIGNPLYHWSHLELRRYFGYDGYLNGDTAEEVWNLCNAKLQEDSMTVRGLIKQSGVTLICTTDDPVDTLEWHQKIAADDTFDVQVLPAWRPDKAMNVEKPTFAPYIAQLSQVSGIAVTDLASLKDALKPHGILCRQRLLRIRPRSGVCDVRSRLRRRSGRDPEKGLKGRGYLQGG